MRKEPLFNLVCAITWLLLVSPPVYPQAETTSTQPNLVHFGDLIEVDVVGSFEYDWRGTLTPEGFLDGLDSVADPIYALCKSENDLSAALRKALSTTLRDPQVTVRILDRSNRAVAFVTGAIRSPQRFQIKRAVYLSELLVLSGGITDRSSGEILIFRPANLSCTDPKRSSEGEFVKASQPGGAETRTIKISDILRGEAGSNPRINSGDIVTVTEAFPVYVIGGVNNPQQVPLRNQLTLSRVVSMAGGLTKQGNSGVKVFRREGKETRVIHADLQKIASGTEEDPVLRPFDVVDVPEKGKPARAKPPVIEGQSNGMTLANLPLRIID